MGSTICPVIKVCANPETFQRLHDDIDINAGCFLYDQADLAEIGDEIIHKVLATTQSMHTKSESVLHQEIIMAYKFFSPIGSTCLPILQSHLNLSVT